MNKDKAERIKEVIKVITKLHELGLNDNYEGVQEFKKILKQFVDDGYHTKGKINVRGTKRQIQYNFPERAGNEIFVKLKYNESI